MVGGERRIARALRLAAFAGVGALALGAACVQRVCACSWTSGAVAYGSVTAIPGGEALAGARVRFEVFIGPRSGRVCTGRSLGIVRGEAATDAAGRYRHVVKLSNSTPVACVRAIGAPPPAGADFVGTAEAVGGPVRFEVCGDSCGVDSVRIDLAVPYPDAP